MSHVQVRRNSCGQFHKCVHHQMVLHCPDHSWDFSSGFFPSSFLGCGHHDI